MLNGLDLFSGIGGLSIALSEWVRPIAYCEIDSHCQGVLLSRIHKRELWNAPIWDDIRTYPIRDLCTDIDIIYGGFPCQDISVAGHGKGLDGERSGLFFEIVRLAKEIQPKFLFIENVPAITSRGGLRIVREITEMGYDCRWCIISAEEFVDQNRERWFFLAKLNSQRFEQRAGEDLQQEREASIDEESCHHKLQDMESWTTFACGVRAVNGIPNRVDRIRALGNSVVPQQAKEAFEILMGLKNQPHAIAKKYQ